MLPSAPISNDVKLVNLSSPTQVFLRGAPLRFTALRGKPGTCTEVRVTIDGKSRIDKNPTFPYAIEVGSRDAIYPTKSGKYDIVVEGLAPTCVGRLTYTFAYNVSNKGVITDVVPGGFEYPNGPARLTVMGHGLCKLRVATYDAPYNHNTSSPLAMEFVREPVQLPHTIELSRGTQFGGQLVAEVLALEVKADGAPNPEVKQQPGFEGCSVSVPGNASTFMLQKTFQTFAPGTKPPANANANGGGGSPTAAGSGGASAGQYAAATGKISTLQVPGGSFAEDEAQKLLVSGSGGCGLDLSIKRLDAGGSFDKSWPVNPVALDKGATLYNGTHFDTLAEGSYTAKVVGKNGCTGTATIDFKVTPRTTTKSVKGKPTIAFEKGPIAGSAFRRTKDGNVNFVVKVPQSVKDEPYAGCCDIEFDYRNAYGGWEALPNSPFNDSSFGLAITQPGGGIVPKSVSGFKEGTFWRVKVRAYKYKTEFEWSDWLEFQVDQN